MAKHAGPGELESVWLAQQIPPGESGRLLIVLDGHTVVDATWSQLVDRLHGAPFVYPLALNIHQSLGGMSLQVPMPFQHNMSVISERNPHYFHVVYRTFASGAAIGSFRAAPGNPADVVSDLRRAGTRDPKPRAGRPTYVRRTFRLRAGDEATLAQLSGSGVVTEIRLHLSRYGASGRANAEAGADDVYEHARLRMTFDGRRTVDAPLGEFFGSGLGPAKVRALMFGMDDAPTGTMVCWWPMPFARSASIQLLNASHTAVSAASFRLGWVRGTAWRQRLATGAYGYFHAQGHAGMTQPGNDWIFLRTRGTGTFVGVTLTMKGSGIPFYLEGNERGFIDGARRPQIQGTGTEDFFDGGWYFWDHLFTLPLSGYSAHELHGPNCVASSCKTAYRLMIADAVSFDRSILYEIQHGPEDNIDARYSSTAYWYARGGADSTGGPAPDAR